MFLGYPVSMETNRKRSGRSQGSYKTPVEFQRYRKFLESHGFKNIHRVWFTSCGIASGTHEIQVGGKNLFIYGENPRLIIPRTRDARAASLLPLVRDSNPGPAPI